MTEKQIMTENIINLILYDTITNVNYNITLLHGSKSDLNSANQEIPKML
jgi:hypothetical protein